MEKDRGKEKEKRKTRPQPEKQRKAPKKAKAGSRMTPAFVTRLFIAGTACVLIVVLVLIAATRYLRKDEAAAPVEEPVALVEFAPLQVFSAQFDTLPDPTQAPQPVPENAIDLVVDGVPVLGFYSKEAAQIALTAFLDRQATAPEGERLCSASYECEILFTTASGLVPLVGENEALALMLETPGLVPVTVHTEKRTADTGAAQVSSYSDSTVAKGTMFITQLGTGARTETVTQQTYVGGQLVFSGDPESQIVAAARTTLIRTGAYRAKDPDGEPGKNEGKKWKDEGELSFALPMHGEISSYFGTRNGRMHNGVDISAKAGTAVAAPEEGIVIYCAERGAYGFTVDIDHGNGFVSRLTHVSGAELQLHQRVFKGDALAVLAETDGDSAPHLHYELIVDGIPVNPMYYLP